MGNFGQEDKDDSNPSLNEVNLHCEYFPASPQRLLMAKFLLSRRQVRQYFIFPYKKPISAMQQRYYTGEIACLDRHMTQPKDAIAVHEPSNIWEKQSNAESNLTRQGIGSRKQKSNCQGILQPSSLLWLVGLKA